jgi:hypothetical protein
MECSGPPVLAEDGRGNGGAASGAQTIIGTVLSKKQVPLPASVLSCNRNDNALTLHRHLYCKL